MFRIRLHLVSSVYQPFNVSLAKSQMSYVAYIGLPESCDKASTF